MSFYYDIELNFNEERIWEFYEWEKNDVLTHIKKIPLFKVDSNILYDFLEYQIILDKEFMSSIKKKTITNKETIDYAFIISDGKNALALESNDLGNLVCYSKLTLEDENNLNEIIFTIKKTEINYQKEEKKIIDHTLRQINYEKKIISCELNTLNDKKDKTKMQYLYYEYFGEIDSDFKKMYQKLNQLLEQEYDENLHHIYELIKLSYSNV